MPPVLAKSTSTPAVFQRPVIQELYQGRSAVESCLDYRIEDMQYEGQAANGRDRSALDITERHSEVVGQWSICRDRFAREVNDFAITSPKDVCGYREGILKDCEVQAADHERLVAREQRERMLQKHQRQMAQSLAGFIASQQLGLTKPAWTYTDPPGFFERASSVGSIVDATPSENFKKDSLMGMWNTAGYRHCHSDSNVLKPTTPGPNANKKMTTREANELYQEYMKDKTRMPLSGPTEQQMQREGWQYFREFGDEYFGRWKGIDVDVESKHPRHSFLHSVDQEKLRGKKEKHYNATTTKAVKEMKEQHRQDMINLTTGWRRREKMVSDAHDFSALAPEGRRRNDWSAQDKGIDYLEQPIYNALSDEPYNGPIKDLIFVPKRAVDYAHTDFVCGESRAPGGVTGSFSDPRVTSSRTMSGDFWLPPEQVSTMNKGVPRVQKKFDHWNRSAKQYWAREAVRKKGAGGKREAPKAVDPEKSGPTTFQFSKHPNRWCWSMRVHSGSEQQEIAIEADPTWTVNQLLLKLLVEATRVGLIPGQTVKGSVNKEDAVWSLLESKARGQSSTVDRTASLETIGLDALKGSHLTRVGLAASLVSPLADATGTRLSSSLSAPSFPPLTSTRRNSKERSALAH